jgi:spore maturation protein CgeB
VPHLFACSRIVLGIGTVAQSDRLVALKMRDFDGPMSGSCYVTQRNSDLELLYEVGEEIAVYGSDDECVHVVRELLNDDRRREQIAAAGRRRAASAHTWELRFRQLLAVLRGEETGVEYG